MGRKLPSLKALRSFEAAARHSSFSRAADELFVTHAAISRQVRELEAWLGHRLFVRSGRGVVPTEPASEYQRTLTRLFDQMEEATRRIARASTTELLVQVDLAFATQWLVARLGRFQLAHPDVQVSLEPTYEAFDPRSTRAELGIQYSDSDDLASPPAETLVLVRAFPVCSASFLARAPLRRAADLIGQPLLHEESRSWWAEWLAAVGEAPDATLEGPFYDETHLALLAAEAGQGFALGDDLLVFDAIRTGRLVRALDVSCPSGSYQLLTRPKRALSSAAEAFVAWLWMEIEAFKAGLAGPDDDRDRELRSTR